VTANHSAMNVNVVYQRSRPIYYIIHAERYTISKNVREKYFTCSFLKE